MEMQANVLDLDQSKSIKEYDVGMDTKFSLNAINKLIQLIRKFGKFICQVEREIGAVSQYLLPIKYLNHVLNIIFEFDYSCQYIYIILYNTDQSKTYLKIYLSISDEPTIKYIENDHSGII